jgi:UDP-N-acetylmuramoyl-L-alanyl-D-glutamate--2,6-diaminopimelate ligase
MSFDKMQLKDLIAALRPVSVEGTLDREIVGITYDSRRVTPGMIFVAIRGRQVDGHAFIPNAIDRGAAAIVYERNGFLSQRATRIKVADAREALANLAVAFYGNPSAKLKVIGVTGTNGKTTVAFMVQHLLEAAGVGTGLLGTIRYEIGERVIPAQRTTPESLEIQHMMAQMVRAGCRACVLEVSSHALEQKRVLGIEFDTAVFTNLTQDHLDYHGSMEAYFQAKARLFTELRSPTKKGTAVINIDDAYGAKLSERNQIEVLLTFGLDQTAQLRASEIELNSGGARFTVEQGERRQVCQLPLPGRHNVYNALAAIGAGLALGLPFDAVVSSLNSLAPVPGRLEKIASGQPFNVLVDYAHTDDALRNVLTTLREITRGRLLLVFGCGGSRDAGKRPKMGRVAAELADFTCITSDNPRRESAALIASQIESGFRQCRDSGYSIELDRRRAIDELIRRANVGDTVLIAGKGHETYQEFEDTIVPFDDRVFARETLQNLGFMELGENAAA